MTQHWHAYAYTGAQFPPDSEAKNPHSATPPHEIDMWFRKPRSMLAATFTGQQAGAAHEWLRTELAHAPPPSDAVAATTHLALARDALDRAADVYTGYYTATGRFLIRALLACPRPYERCPDPPQPDA